MSDSLPPLPPVTDPRNTKTGALVVVPPAEPVEASPEATPEAATEAAPEAAKEPAEEEFTLPELAQREGQAARPSPDGGAYFWKHRLAAFMHGWDSHEYNQQTKIKLTLTDYKAALEAAVAGNTHAPAVRN